jgi:hypothetical protein
MDLKKIMMAELIGLANPEKPKPNWMLSRNFIS